MPTLSPQKLASHNPGPYVTTDLQLAKSRLTRPMLLEDIQFAMFNDGFFVIEDADSSALDSVMSQLNLLLPKFFQLPQSVKKEIDITHSAHFRGYHSYSTTELCESDEEVIFGADLPSPTQFDDDFEDLSETQTLGGTPVYQWIRGPNQWPKPRALPKFQHTVESFMEAMNTFSTSLLNQLVPEAIGSNAPLFENAFDLPEPQNQVRFIKKSPNGNQETSTSDSFAFKNKLAFATYLVRVENDTSTLKIIGSDGRVTYLSPPPGSIVVVFSESMEQLTRGLCKSASYSLTSTSTTSYIASFTQCLSIDFNHKNYVFPRSLLRQSQRKSSNTCEIYCDDDEEVQTPFQFFDDYGMSVFSEYLRHFPSVTARWYSHLSSQYSSSIASGKLPRKLAHLVQLHKSIDDSILLHTISSSAPISLATLYSRVSEDSRLTLEVSYLQQILTVWPESYTISNSVVNKLELTVSIPLSLDRKVTLIQSLPARQQTFERKCFEYAKANPKNCVNIPKRPFTIHPKKEGGEQPRRVLSSHMAMVNKRSREQVSPYALSRKPSVPLTGTSASRLNRVASSALQQASPVKKGSVFERIRAKEQAAKEALKFAESPQVRHDKYIESKLPSIASIVAGLRVTRQGSLGETYALPFVLNKIMDSVRTTLSAKESEEALCMLAQKMPDFCTLTTVGKVTGVCIHNNLSITTIKQRLASVAVN